MQKGKWWPWVQVLRVWDMELDNTMVTKRAFAVVRLVLHLIRRQNNVDHKDEIQKRSKHNTIKA